MTWCFTIMIGLRYTFHNWRRTQPMTREWHHVLLVKIATVSWWSSFGSFSSNHSSDVKQRSWFIHTHIYIYICNHICIHIHRVTNTYSHIDRYCMIFYFQDAFINSKVSWWGPILFQGLVNVPTIGDFGHHLQKIVGDAMYPSLLGDMTNLDIYQPLV